MPTQVNTDFVDIRGRYFLYSPDEPVAGGDGW